MFKWPGEPSPSDEAHELADYVELVAWREGSMSAVALGRFLGRREDPDYSDGVPEEDEVDTDVEDAFGEIERRREACAGGYPFVLDGNGTIVQREGHIDGEENARYAIYEYLLLATRLDMKNDRGHGGYDGTRLLEELAAEAARSYLGSRSESMVFGTAASTGGFPARVDELCSRMAEGGGFANHDNTAPRQQDGKLDVVAWTPFSDRLPGQLIMFGQCKTGTHYKDQLAQLQPDAFCSKWLRTQPAVMPARAFFLAEALPRSGWRDSAVDAGVLFDRCRIVDFARDASADLLAKVRDWTRAAAQARMLAGEARTAPPARFFPESGHIARTS